ncbi:MAG: hypothetical protein VYD57_08010 [Pseudomonadota bacterium]|nr:hypothetical protein [Pseudomonadota bacterium]
MASRSTVSAHLCNDFVSYWINAWIDLKPRLLYGENSIYKAQESVAISPTPFHCSVAQHQNNGGVISMRKVLLTMSALAAAVSFSATAEAKYYKKHVDERSAKCYVVEYIPSTYKYNTKGKLVTGESTTWSGEIVDGGKVYHRRNPAVYMTTKKLVEQDHYTLTGC